MTFAALAAALRWPAVAGHLGVGAVVRWSELLRDEGSMGVSLPLRLIDGTSSSDLTQAADRLRSMYRCARVDVSPDPTRGDRVVLRLFHDAEPPSLPYPWQERAAEVVPPRWDVPVPLGVTASGALASVPLFDRTMGGSSLLIGGVPGSGKSTALRVVMAGLCPTTTTMLLIDPTGGAEARLWLPRLSAVVDDADATPTIDLLRQVLGLIELRGRLLGLGCPIALLSPVLLVVDELAEMAAAGQPKAQDEARALLRRIVALGRKANVACVLATQRTTATSIDITTRSLVSWRFALAHPDDPHGSEALLGPGRHDAARLSKRSVGAGYLTNGGSPELVRVFVLERESVPTLLAGGALLSLAQVRSLDEAALREYELAAPPPSP